MLLVVQILIIGSNLFNNVRPTGLEPVTNQLCFTTMTFATLSVCGLDYAFIRSGCLPSSLYTFLFRGLARRCHLISP